MSLEHEKWVENGFILKILIMQVSGPSNIAGVLQTDIPACGPSLLQLTDAVLVPPTFNLDSTAGVLPIAIAAEPPTLVTEG